MEAAKQTEYGDQLDKLTETMEEIREAQEASDLKAARRKAGTLPPWERGEENAQ
jgi:hypothetical protein